MIDWSLVRAIVLDIEGTTCPVDFVAGTLFPYAREHLSDLIDQSAESNAIAPLLQELWQAWEQETELQAPALPEERQPLQLVSYLQWLIDQDRKLTPLKELQGLVWEEGYRSGALRTPLFDDVAPALQHWQRSGLRLAVYSSGSVKAQQLFYGHTAHGDLTGLFEAWYDTRLGAKKDAQSYRDLAADLALQPQEVLFISDANAELSAAQEAGIQICGSGRPGNPETLESRWFAVERLSTLAEQRQVHLA